MKKYKCPNCESERIVEEKYDEYSALDKDDIGTLLMCIDCGYAWYYFKSKTINKKDKIEHEKFKVLGRMTDNDLLDLKIDLELFKKQKE